MFDTALARNGLIAILRGIAPDEAEAIGQALYAAGIRIVEVPLNSPQPLRSIETLRRTLPEDCLVGAGTVLHAQQVQHLKDAGGQLVVMPHCDATVIQAAVAAGLSCAPGVATPSEAFAALAAGADALKIFPAEQIGPGALKAWLTVLPEDTALLPVGGITPERMAPYLAAGAVGFGLGGALYRPGMSSAEVGRLAQTFIQARHMTAG
ncbi:2-dehydro-3-deoxy-6-phosphogalactonate aldolase [Stutzerimonas azotifigens]|uniref:2-dehydro-3-deoxy-6-phosphogalactonate aldolase n=1 Tax=Stutzerimonas azotifigens TaxID=291995 RepID=A0ABR5Z5Q2_9GAMM|nr:2-dehydro-3-deoxy-6-phosphogalactonate aldolase [Stutzerimonas azotifigens]MBA1275547.1 2-dehydro-3-deoxy-6-phosphogalactonate aldolase [Stutzerimonas azotifigens]